MPPTNDANNMPRLRLLSLIKPFVSCNALAWEQIHELFCILKEQNTQQLDDSFESLSMEALPLLKVTTSEPDTTDQQKEIKEKISLLCLKHQAFFAQCMSAVSEISASGQYFDLLLQDFAQGAQTGQFKQTEAENYIGYAFQQDLEHLKCAYTRLLQACGTDFTLDVALGSRADEYDRTKKNKAKRELLADLQAQRRAMRDLQGCHSSLPNEKNLLAKLHAYESLQAPGFDMQRDALMLALRLSQYNQALKSVSADPVTENAIEQLRKAAGNLIQELKRSPLRSMLPVEVCNGTLEKELAGITNSRNAIERDAIIACMSGTKASPRLGNEPGDLSHLNRLISDARQCADKKLDVLDAMLTAFSPTNNELTHKDPAIAAMHAITLPTMIYDAATAQKQVKTVSELSTDVAVKTAYAALAPMASRREAETFYSSTMSVELDNEHFIADTKDAQAARLKIMEYIDQLLAADTFADLVGKKGDDVAYPDNLNSTINTRDAVKNIIQTMISAPGSNPIKQRETAHKQLKAIRTYLYQQAIARLSEENAALLLTRVETILEGNPDNIATFQAVFNDDPSEEEHNPANHVNQLILQLINIDDTLENARLVTAGLKSIQLQLQLRVPAQKALAQARAQSGETIVIKKEELPVRKQEDDVTSCLNAVEKDDRTALAEHVGKALIAAGLDTIKGKLTTNNDIEKAILRALPTDDADLDRAKKQLQRIRTHLYQTSIAELDLTSAQLVLGKVMAALTKTDLGPIKGELKDTYNENAEYVRAIILRFLPDTTTGPEALALLAQMKNQLLDRICTLSATVEESLIALPAIKEPLDKMLNGAAFVEPTTTILRGLADKKDPANVMDQTYIHEKVYKRIYDLAMTEANIPAANLQALLARIGEILAQQDITGLNAGAAFPDDANAQAIIDQLKLLMPDASWQADKNSYIKPLLAYIHARLNKDLTQDIHQQLKSSLDPSLPCMKPEVIQYLSDHVIDQARCEALLVKVNQAITLGEQTTANIRGCFTGYEAIIAALPNAVSNTDAKKFIRNLREYLSAKNKILIARQSSIANNNRTAVPDNTTIETQIAVAAHVITNEANIMDAQTGAVVSAHLYLEAATSHDSPQKLTKTAGDAARTEIGHLNLQPQAFIESTMGGAKTENDIHTAAAKTSKEVSAEIERGKKGAPTTSAVAHDRRTEADTTIKKALTTPDTTVFHRFFKALSFSQTIYSWNSRAEKTVSAVNEGKSVHLNRMSGGGFMARFKNCTDEECVQINRDELDLAIQPKTVNANITITPERLSWYKDSIKIYTPNDPTKKSSASAAAGLEADEHLVLLSYNVYDISGKNWRGQQKVHTEFRYVKAKIEAGDKITISYLSKERPNIATAENPHQLSQEELFTNWAGSGQHFEHQGIQRVNQLSSAPRLH